MFKNKDSIIFLIAIVILGLMLGLQIKSVSHSNEVNGKKQSANKDLPELLEKERQKSERLKNQISELEKKNTKEFEKYAEYDNKHAKQFNGKINKAKIEAGLVPVKGTGIKISLNDAEADLKSLHDMNEVVFKIVHDQDVSEILNELKIAGAQAISINGERIISTSAVVCAGPTILINGRRYIVPFEILAIGDKDNLYNVLTSSTIYQLLISSGIRISIEKLDEINIPKYIINEKKVGK